MTVALPYFTYILSIFVDITHTEVCIDFRCYATLFIQ